MAAKPSSISAWFWVKCAAMRKILVFCLVVVTLSLSVYAQNPAPITSYTAKYYNVGAPSPVSSFVFQATAVVCNQAPITTVTPLNPTKFQWDDPASTGKVCIWTDPGTGPLVSIPIGSYEATLVATNSVGDSPESNRAPFQRASVPAVLTNVRLTR